MGKSQLAFALGGSRPWFYWPTSPIATESQRLYQNFSSVSKAFYKVTNMDGPTTKSEHSILNGSSDLYDESLWTYGFIRALLEYCSKDENQHGQMIRFPEGMSSYVNKCDREVSIALREKMKAEGKILPFFVLDETTPNTDIDGGDLLVVFQRNVFRACGMVVVVMGTDAKITHLMHQPRPGSYTRAYTWATIISHFPPYQPVKLADEEKQTAWERLQAQYPVLNSIVVNSRGLFARYFVDSAAQYAVENTANGVKLCDLLDAAFAHVSLMTQRHKPFMEKQEGKDAQLMAISYTNVGNVSTSPPLRKKRKVVVGAYCMHSHFANLVYHQIDEVTVAAGRLRVDNQLWQPWCSFPTIEEDLLLYLAVLGGKMYSGYYDHAHNTDYSTLHIFSTYSKGTGFSTGENTNAVSNNYKTFENMVAHMVFCASRRNGVQGIPFNDFFAGLLSECQDEIRSVTMTIGNTGVTIIASDLRSTLI